MAASRSGAFLGGLLVAAGTYYAITTNVLGKLERSRATLIQANSNLRRATNTEEADVEAQTASSDAKGQGDIPRILTIYHEEKDRMQHSIIPRAKDTWNQQLLRLASRVHATQQDVTEWIWGRVEGPGDKKQ
ncbi:hypothetical protein IWQ60_000546 [Tieghemiomyces parasiticus]|uniref:Uncharacterized protein n=1 Tax=Tieghemiomyces parasiticus TaxID=78921 RepID=A0A9W8AGA4_9FUNG|nr:hypothetical protein IWQ60_000546 [Tieghemiomyces parasiticus]